MNHKYKVTYCCYDLLERRLNSVGGEIISVTWQPAPYSRFIIVYKVEQ